MCQEEFYSPNETKIAIPFTFDNEESRSKLCDVKIGNIRLIGKIYFNTR